MKSIMSVEEALRLLQSSDFNSHQIVLQEVLGELQQWEWIPDGDMAEEQVEDAITLSKIINLLITIKESHNEFGETEESLAAT